MSELNPKEYPQRTAQQNKALHVLFTLLGNELNQAGLDMRRTLKPEIDIPWSRRSVKEYLWRPIQKAQLNKTSTTELTTKEIDEVFDTLVRHLGEKFGLTVAFPSIETIMQEQESERRVRKEREDYFKKEMEEDNEEL